MNMSPPSSPRDTDREASPKAKRAWTKPTIKKMSYVYLVASGPLHIDASLEKVKYVPSS